MANLEPYVRSRTDKLDSLGNTTAATGKGLAIASATLTAVGLIAGMYKRLFPQTMRCHSYPSLSAAFVEQSGLASSSSLNVNTPVAHIVDLTNSLVLTGVLIG
jgi:Na+/H+-translocating membrane pyrophosphatase